ncbi:MAG: hypothetical protein K6G51_06795 [Sphaerochaetaceae bacterium]|nr:hypothetical protein [Sphaerochaetaceae bacterium]
MKEEGNNIRIRKGTKVTLALALFLCAFGIFMIFSAKMSNPIMDKFFSLVRANLCISKSSYALPVFGTVSLFLGLFTLYARGKRAYLHIVTFAFAILYFSIVVVVNTLDGITTPTFFVSKLSTLPEFYAPLILLVEILVTFLLFKFALFLNRTDHVRDKRILEEEAKKSAKEIRNEKKEMRAAKKALRMEKKEMKALSKQKKAEERLKKQESKQLNARMAEEKKQEEEEIMLQEEALRVKREEKKMEFDELRRDRARMEERNSEPASVSKINNSGSFWVPSYSRMPDFSSGEEKSIPAAPVIEIKETAPVSSPAFTSAKIEEEKKEPEANAGLFFSSIAEAADKSMDTKRPDNIGPIKGFYEDETPVRESKPSSSIAPSNLSPNHPRYKMFESLKNSNPKPVTTAEEQKSNTSNFAPSNLSPNHPRYKLFESLKKTPEENRAEDRLREERKEEPKKEEISFAPSSLSPSHPRYKLFEALQKKPAEKAPVKAAERYTESTPKMSTNTSPRKEIYGEEEVIDIGEETFAPEPEHKRRPIYESVRTSDNELPRDTGYYQKESTAKGVNGFVVEDVKPREAPLTKSQEVEFKVGVAGLASNEAGLDAIKARQRKGYNPPPISLLVDYPTSSYAVDERTDMVGQRIQDTMHEFRVEVFYKNAVKGPSVTMFCYDLAPGIMVNAVKRLEQNIKLAIGGKNVRILAPIPGRSEIGVEVPNDKVATVGFKELLPTLNSKNAAVPLLLGRNIYGEPQLVDVAKTPHLLIAGTTGSGKSVCINSLIASILYSKSPKEVRLIMVDPKVVELTVYNGLPHLLTPVITDNKRVLKMLSWLCDEMERRYSLLSQMGLRKIDAYNDRIHEMGYATEKLPYIVLIMDEYADLMLTVGKEMEGYLQRLLQKARAAGIHVVLATQRPSAQVVTGVIKANIPARIAFRVASGIDSGIILGEGGAENLLGRGDMLMNVGYGTNRLQGCFLSDDEVFEIVRYAKSQGEPDYLDESIFEDDVEDEDDGYSESSSSVGTDGDLYERAKAIIWERKCASASYLQRRLGIGYNKAARIVEQMEEEGLVGPANGSKPREVLRYE